VKGFLGRRQQEGVVGSEAQPWSDATRAVSLTPAAVYDAYAELVFGWAARLAGPTLDPEDLVHEVFLVVQQQLSKFRGDAKLTTWLYRITANVVLDRRRKERRRWWRNRRAGDEAARAPAGPTPLEELEQRREHELVYRVLDTMNEKHRTVLVLFELEGHSGEEIARLMGTRSETVWVWLNRARAQFRQRLERLAPDELPPGWRRGEKP
jgi:RNA polymerase sigma-70 factor (ECF subfamily)